MIGFVLLMFLAQIAAFPVTANESQARGDCSSCEIVERALKDVRNLKVGMTRQDMEKSAFAPAGGWAVRDHADYVYKSCDYIKVEIDFTIDPTVKGSFSPKDTISKVSGLEIAYPARD